MGIQNQPKWGPEIDQNEDPKIDQNRETNKIRGQF